MIARFFKFLALLWYADEHGWPEKEQPTASEPTGTAPAGCNALDKERGG